MKGLFPFLRELFFGPDLRPLATCLIVAVLVAQVYMGEWKSVLTFSGSVIAGYLLSKI